jgi:hypothetical protein
VRPHRGAPAALKAPAAGLRPRQEPKGGRKGWHSNGTQCEGNDRGPAHTLLPSQTACASALAVGPLLIVFALTARIARSCRMSFRLRASISPRRSKLSWSTQALNMVSSDRVQRDPPRGCLRAFALAVVVMRSALDDIWRSIRSRCALVCRCAASIRESRFVPPGTLTPPSPRRAPVP